MTKITPTNLEVYVSRFYARHEKYPTFRQVAKRFRCTYDEIEGAIYDYVGKSYMGMAVGCQVGTAIYVCPTRGLYEVECYS